MNISRVKVRSKLASLRFRDFVLCLAIVAVPATGILSSNHDTTNLLAGKFSELYHKANQERPLIEVLQERVNAKELLVV